MTDERNQRWKGLALVMGVLVPVSVAVGFWAGHTVGKLQARPWATLNARFLVEQPSLQPPYRTREAAVEAVIRHPEMREVVREFLDTRTEWRDVPHFGWATEVERDRDSGVWHVSFSAGSSPTYHCSASLRPEGELAEAPRCWVEQTSS